MRTMILFACLIATLPAQATLKVLACEPEWAALTTELAGDRVDITVATSPVQDPHHVQARPSLISAARRADLAICTGADLEIGWLPVLLNKGANPSIRTVPGLFLAADQVTLLDIPESVSRSDGDVHAAGNPHLHLDPQRMLQVAEALAARLEQLDPEGSAEYQANLARMQASWPTMMAELETDAASLAGVEVVSHHANFRYLAHWLGMRTVAQLEPKPGVPPSPGHLARLVEQVGNSQARLVLYTDYNGNQAATWLAERTGLCALKLPFTTGAVPGTDTLAGLYRHLVSTMVKALEQCPDE